MTDAARLASDDAAWDAWVAATPPSFHLQQTGWARAKAPNGWRPVRVVADGGSGPIGAQVLVRRLGPGPFSLGYAPRGPVATTWDAASVAAFTDALRRTARAHRLTHVTVDPGTDDPAVPAALRAAGWRPADAVQHGRSRVVDTTIGEAALWAGLRSKWRQYVTRAQRAGVEVAEGTRADLPAFHAILAATAVRTGFFHRTLGAYEAAWDAFAPEGAVRLLVARLDGIPVAALFIVRCGPRVAEPYGGMTDAGAASRANYLLKWEAIRHAAAEGAACYDMWGIAHAGIAQFKEGFGGREVVYPGAFDLVTMPLVRDAIGAARRTRVRIARRRLGAGSAEAVAGDPSGGGGG